MFFLHFRSTRNEVKAQIPTTMPMMRMASVDNPASPLPVALDEVSFAEDVDGATVGIAVGARKTLTGEVVTDFVTTIDDPVMPCATAYACSRFVWNVPVSSAEVTLSDTAFFIFCALYYT